MTYYQKNEYPKSFTVKKPVRSFRDLEVYQKTLELSVIVAKNLKAVLAKARYPLVENMVNCSMSIPLFIGEAHSLRFGDHARGIAFLEKAMADCNKMVIYLEQCLGIYGGRVDGDLVEDLVRRYAEVRTKIFHLEKSWQKFYPPQHPLIPFNPL